MKITKSLVFRTRRRHEISTSLLDVRELSKYFRTRYGTVHAVDRVSFSVESRETVSIVGESGSGKSTIGYTVVGIYAPTAGEIYFEGQNVAVPVTKRPKSIKRDLQIVFQDPHSSLNPRLPIGKILQRPFKVHAARGKNKKGCGQRVIELLEQVELSPDYADKISSTLSGGEKARVAIARALATKPKLVVLDEPTASLDVSIQAKIIAMLYEFQQELHLSYCCISHDLSLMRNVANRIIIMYLGKICESSETEEFFKNPLHPYSQMLLSSIPVVLDEEEKMKPQKIQASGEIPSPVNVPAGCSFHPRCVHTMDICRRDDPVMGEVETSHFVRCHLYSQQGTEVVR